MLNQQSIAKEIAWSWSSLLLLVPLGVMAVGVPGQTEKSLETVPNPRISLSNRSGQVVVVGWDKSQVHAVYFTSSSRMEVDTEQFPTSGAAEKIRFTTHILDPLVNGKDETADYTLEVPFGASVEIRNPQGIMRVEKLQGDTSLESVGGSIHVADVAGHLDVRSVGGDIEIVRPSGRVEAYSINGNLRFIAPATSKLRGSTTSGKITYEGDFASGGDYILSAYSGDVDVSCPPSASFELRAKSVRGKVDSAFPLNLKRHSPSPLSPGNSLLGTRNTGNATVGLTSFSGNIRIHLQQ